VGRHELSPIIENSEALTLELETCDPWLWTFFRDFHYKTKSISSTARTFVLHHNGRLVGFSATIKQMGGGYRAHRTVILPSWQGLGIGSRLSDSVAQLHSLEGERFLAQTVHPRFGSYRDNSQFWKPTEWNHNVNKYKIESWKHRRANVKVKLQVPKFIYSHEFIGPQDEAAGEYFRKHRMVLY